MKLKTFKDFYFGDRVINEAVHPEIQHILDTERESRRLLPEIMIKHAELSAKGIKSGVGNMASGSSRTVFVHGTPHRMRLKHSDGTITEHNMPVVSKVAMLGELDHYRIRPHEEQAPTHHHTMLLGQLQNINEGHQSLDQHRIFTRNSDGTHSYNPNGILPAIFGDRHPHGNHLLIQKVTPYTEEDRHLFENHHGINPIDLHESLYNDWRRHILGKPISKVGDDTTRNSHIFRETSKLMGMGIHPGDLSLHSENTAHYDAGKDGIPGGKIHFVVGDPGFVQSVYGTPTGMVNTVAHYFHRRERMWEANR